MLGTLQEIASIVSTLFSFENQILHLILISFILYIYRYINLCMHMIMILRGSTYLRLLLKMCMRKTIKNEI